MLDKLSPKAKKVLLWIVIALIIIALLYFYTYFFAEKNGKVIYEKNGRRIYLIKRFPYSKPGREMWRLLLEDQKDGKRFFIIANSPKGFKSARMADVINNTFDKGKMYSYDQLQQVGVTLRPANTDVHSNLVDKKNPIAEMFPEDIEDELMSKMKF